MAVSTIRRNQVIDWNGEAYRLAGLSEDSHWQLVSMKDASLARIAVDELLDQYRIGNLRLRVVAEEARDLAADFREATDPPLKITGKARKADRLIALTKATRTQRLLEARRQAKLVKIASEYPLGSPIQEQVIRDAWPKIYGKPAPEQLPVKSTLWKWMQKLEKSGGDVRSLIKNHHLKGRTKKDLTEEQFAIIQEATEEIYLTSNRKSMRDVEVEVIDRVRAANALADPDKKIETPSFERIKEYIQELPEFDKFAARHGLPAAQKKFRGVLKSVFADRPLERVELDAARLDFIAVDDYGVPLGRPWLHVCIDVRTRCILGYYISFEPPSLASLFECLKHAILPKSKAWLTSVGVENPYPCYGVFEEIVFDNAFENHSDALHPLVDTWGGDIQFCPRRSPWFKAKIERFIRTFSEQLCQTLPGATFSNFLEKGDYDPVENAVIKWRDIERIAAIWICDVYHQRPHRTLQATPANAWSALTKPDQLLLPCDVTDIIQVCRVPEIRRLTHKGIESLDMFWNSSDLIRMRQEVGAETDARVFFDRMNLGTIGVEHPTRREIVEVRNLAFEYANNLTLYQHKVNRAYAKRLNPDRETSVLEWIDAQKKILGIIEEARTIKGYCLPAFASRYLLGNGERSELPAAPPQITKIEGPPIEAPKSPTSAAGSTKKKVKRSKSKVSIQKTRKPRQ